MFEYDYKCAIKSDNIHISLNNGPDINTLKKAFYSGKVIAV